MVYGYRVKIPSSKRINVAKSNGRFEYVYYTYGRERVKEKGYYIAKRVSVGRRCEDDPGEMYPNERFYEYFPDAERPEGAEGPRERCSCLSAGMYLVLRRLARETGLEEILKGILGDDYGLFMDLAFYCITEESDAYQHYERYSYGHPLMTEGMRRYGDTAISNLLRRVTEEQRDAFLREWNARAAERGLVYISYDSTNKYCVGDIRISAPSAKTKGGLDKPVVNYAVAYDQDNAVPLFYELYSGSLVDVTMIESTVATARDFGYTDAVFIMDRGYYSKDNFGHMDDAGYGFIAMVKGQNRYVTEYIKGVKGTFEDKFGCRIERYGVSGTTVKGPMFSPDVRSGRDRWIHIYHSLSLEQRERDCVYLTVDRQRRELDRLIERGCTDAGSSFDEHFWLFYEDNAASICSRPAGQIPRGKEKGRLWRYETRNAAIDEEISMCGYFVIATSAETSAAEAIRIYKNRDALEKVFLADKSFLGFDALRVHSDEAMGAKTLIEFVALILRCSMYSALKRENETFESPRNYFTVPMARDILEMINVHRVGGSYRLDGDLTKQQKEILHAFGISPAEMKEDIGLLSKELAACDGEG